MELQEQDERTDGRGTKAHPPIESGSLIVDGMDQEGTSPHQLLGLEAEAKGVSHQGAAESQALMPPVHRKPTQHHHRQWVGHVASQ
jgi:hypothetical protein